MQSSNQESILNNAQKSIIVLFFVLIIISLFILKNLFFQPTLLLKSFGELSIDPEIALKNNKPTFLEFYAEWCEVCKEMAPKVALLKEEYEKDINFVFLNVDNPKWQSYIEKFNVNGIPQLNIFDKKGNLKSTLVGRQEEKTIRDSMDNLNVVLQTNEEIVNSDFSEIRDKKIKQTAARSHG